MQRVLFMAVIILPPLSLIYGVVAHLCCAPWISPMVRIWNAQVDGANVLAVLLAEHQNQMDLPVEC